MSAIFDNWRSICGVIIILVGIIFFIKTLIDRKTSVKLAGEIVDAKIDANGVYFPLIKFVYEGEELCMQGASGDRNPKWNVGDKLNVLYTPKNTKWVNVEGNYGDVIGALAAVVLGLLIIF